MTALTYIAWALNIWVVLTYAMMVRGRWSEFRFDLANALGFIPTATINIMAGVYPPLVLTFSFGLIGLYGALRELYRRHTAQAGGYTYVSAAEWDEHQAHLKAYTDLQRNVIRRASITEIREEYPNV